MSSPAPPSSAAAAAAPPAPPAAPPPSSRPSARKRSSNAATLPRRNNRQSSDDDPSLLPDLGNDFTPPARGDALPLPDKPSLPRPTNKTPVHALENPSPHRPKLVKLSLQANPSVAAAGASTLRQHLLSSLFSRSFVTFVLVAGMVTTFTSWKNPQPPRQPVSMEGQITEMQEILRKTTKMMQVQLDLVDVKIHKEIEGLRKELEEKIEEQTTSFGTELGNIKAKTEHIESSLKSLIDAGFPTRQDVLNLIDSVVEERAAEGSGEALSLDDIRAVARRLVEAELEKHAADGISRADYALGTGGGKVVDHSEGFYQGLGTHWLHFLPGATHKHHLANKVLEPSFGEPGQCLPLKGSKVYIEIALRTSIFPAAFSLEHVTKSVAYDVSSAPKDFRVYGWLDGYKKGDAAAKSLNEVLFGEFVYDIEKKPVQTFSVLPDSREVLINTVRLEVLSNYGSPSHTCIYRFRVHGSDRKAALPVIM